MRVNLFTALGALKVGFDILLKERGCKDSTRFTDTAVCSRQRAWDRASWQQHSILRYPLWRPQVRAAHGVSHFLLPIW